MGLINCETNLILIWYKDFLIPGAATNQATKFAISDTKLHVPVVTLSFNMMQNYYNN